eukprot:7083810-Prymnesium_polylepis.2
MGASTHGQFAGHLPIVRVDPICAHHPCAQQDVHGAGFGESSHNSGIEHLAAWACSNQQRASRVWSRLARGWETSRGKRKNVPNSRLGSAFAKVSNSPAREPGSSQLAERASAQEALFRNSRARSLGPPWHQGRQG